MRRLALVLAFAASACATMAGTPGEVTYAETAQENFKLGMEAFENHSWTDASQYFEHVRTKYPYSQFAALSELRIADTDFGQGHYAEAIDGYKNFIKFRPTHPDVDWASYRIGESHMKSMPSDFIIFPPEIEKDQTEAKAARAAFAEFLAQYPKSKYRGNAETMLHEVTERLAAHEMYVAGFDVKNQHWQGAVYRYTYLLDNYPDSEQVEKAARGLVKASEKVGETDKTRAYLQKFVQQHPGTKVQAVLGGMG